MTTTFSDFDHRMMAIALQLAERGLYTTKPNPRVGCVITQNESIIGTGWHQYAGQAHAEVFALEAARQSIGAKGATAYVTLEPCAHTGRTPPCANALIDAQLARVVIASIDPNPLVNSQGIERLRAAGIQVDVGLLSEQADALNAGFISRMKHQRCFYRGKIATSIDGRIALHNGQSQWLTGPAARNDGHLWRARSCAIVSSVQTILADDAQLTARPDGSERRLSELTTIIQPSKVVLDRRLEIPSRARVLQSGRVILAHQGNKAAVTAAMRRLQDVACELQFVTLPEVDPLLALNQELVKRQFNEVHIESGGKLLGGFLRAKLLDELLHYQAPMLLGEQGKPMLQIGELTHLHSAPRLELISHTRLGADLRLHWQVG